MAKKKIENDSLTKTQKDKNTKPLKPKNKSILKVKIQHKKLQNAISNKKKALEEKNHAKTEMKKMLTMHIQNDMQLDRMNEVARAQLVKECPAAVTECAEAPKPKKRGRKKKILEPETAKVVPKKKPKLPVKAKKQAKIPTKKMTKAKSPKVAALKRKASKAPPSISPLLIKRQRGRPRIRGKPKAEEDSTVISPSILSYCQPEIKTVTDTQKTVPESLYNKIALNPTNNNNDSRRTSVTSAPASELSWTKDISGSSTTTCITVTSNDFVRIDGKMPELKITKLNLNQVENKAEGAEMVMDEEKEPEHSLSEDSSSSSSSSSSSRSCSDSTPIDNGLNLSTSSISAPAYSPTYTPHNQSFDKNKPDEVTSILEMLAPKLKALELDFPNMEDESEDFDINGPFEIKVSKYLEEEYNTMLECSFFSRILFENYPPQTSAPDIEHKHSEEPDFAIPDSAISNKSAVNSVCDTPSNITRRRDTYDPYEDDDVLSIHPDNVFDSTGMSSTASNLEEYVPQALTQRLHPAASYQPSKKDTSETISAKKPVCEKQNADSTSIHKEPEIDDASNETPEAVIETVKGHKQTDKSVTEITRTPLTIHYYPCVAKSITLQGVCFFYLTSNCIKQDKVHTAYYPHRFIEEDEFKRRLAQLGEEQFFQEYNHIARRSTLRNKYIKCFIDECQRRELPKILVEIVIDFLFKTPPKTIEDKDLRVQIVEHALTHLNKWNLIVCDCEQLLGYKIRDEVLCEVFMKIIANTQNFSRFKTVFLNLTDYMVRTNRTFELGVAVQILERVCILPFEAQLAMSLISIMQRTDRAIFMDNMCNVFDMLLSSFNKELHNKFTAIKKGDVPIQSEWLKPVSELVPPCSPSLPSSGCSRGSRELEPLIIKPNSTQDFEQRYTSPDTTNTDNVNKPVTEPTIIRTLNHLNQIRPPNMNMCNRPPPGPSRGNFRNWNNRTILSQVPRMPYMRPPRPMRRPMTRPPLERPQFKYQRRYGPDFLN